MMLQYIIRNAFDKEEAIFQCKEMIKIAEKLGFDDLAKEMKNDLTFEIECKP